jgi:predicted esterase
VTTSTPEAEASTTRTSAKSRSVDPLQSYFTERLAADTLVPYAHPKRLKQKQLDAVAASVWQAWQAALSASTAEHLAPLTPLSVQQASSWAIPSELEPHAVMQYYYGFKTDSAAFVSPTTSTLTAKATTETTSTETTIDNPSNDKTPSTVAPSDKLPLFIYLHGSGPSIIEWTNGINMAQKFADAPSAWFIPRIPNEGEYYRWWQVGKQYAWEKLLREVMAGDAVDPDRICLLGISEGAYGSQRLASFYADYLAAAGPMAGGEPLKNAPAENCANIAFSLLTGERDAGFYRNMLTRTTLAAFDSLAAAHPGQYLHRIELVPERGHFLDYSVMTPWLRGFVRNPYPKQFCWEDFEMDGRRRQGFYNLLIEARPDATARTRYEFSVEEGNVVRLTVDNVAYTTTQTDPQWGIELTFAKSYAPAAKGTIRIFLNDSLVDLSKPVTVIVNGTKRFEGKVKPSLEDMALSCAAYGDPRRVFPASVVVNY